MSDSLTSLATQCPHCGTIFQMQLAQLRDHGHQVRCGRCYAVFNAIQNLTDYSQENDAVAATNNRSALPASHSDEESHTDSATSGTNAQASDHYLNTAQLELPMMSDDWDIEIPFFTPEIARPNPRTLPPISTFRPIEPPEEYEIRNDLFTEEQTEYRTHKIQEQQGFEQVKRFFALSFFILTVVLFTGQVLYMYRNSLVQTFPATRQAVSGFCSLLGCELGPPRNIEALRINQSRLGQVPYRSEQLFLEVLVHNGARQAIAVPHIELSLKDSRGQIVARKIFTPAQLLPPDELDVGLGANSLTNIRTVFSVGNIESSGYSVAVFYP